VERAFSPLDDELALLPGLLAPSLHGWLVRLSSYVPFAQAAALLSEFAHVRLSEGTAQRLTYAAGGAVVEEQTRAAERIIKDAPPPQEGPDCLLLSADGALAPLVGGAWAEVKTLVAGEVSLQPSAENPYQVQTRHLSSFSRLLEAERFSWLSTFETYTRGVERAGTVVAVSDGAEWIQGLFDLQCPMAQRILDFPHAAQRLSTIAGVIWGDGSAAARSWQEAQIHALKHEGPTSVLTAVEALLEAHPDSTSLLEHAAYLNKRRELMEYPAYQRHGWPIASSCVESANKLVVEARLKGAGMHWARTHVNPMVALRNVVCSERWAQVWPQVACHRRVQARQARRERRVKAQAARASGVAPAEQARVPQADLPVGKAHPPAANHPWKKPTLAGGARHNLEQRVAANT
jgi:hypothetical protein